MFQKMGLPGKEALVPGTTNSVQINPAWTDMMCRALATLPTNQRQGCGDNLVFFVPWGKKKDASMIASKTVVEAKSSLDEEGDGDGDEGEKPKSKKKTNQVLVEEIILDANDINKNNVRQGSKVYAKGNQLGLFFPYEPSGGEICFRKFFNFWDKLAPSFSKGLKSAKTSYVNRDVMCKILRLRALAFQKRVSNHFVTICVHCIFLGKGGIRTDSGG
jgi:hypothetical protein